MDLREIAPGLTYDPAGFWRVPGSVSVPYPPGAHEACASIEDESFWFAHRNRVIVAAVRRHPPDGPLFDLGAGNGYVATALENAGFPTIAIEPSAKGAAKSVERGLPNVVCGALPADAFRPHTAGGIAAFDVIEHIEDDRGWLLGIRQYLKPGGRIYLTVPAYQWLWSETDVYSGHHRRYTARRLRRVVESAGFQVEYVTYVFWWLPPAVFLVRRLRGAPQQVERRSMTEHRAGGRLVRRLAGLSCAFEPALVARGVRMPFGASCLLVGRDPGHPA